MSGLIGGDGTLQTIRELLPCPVCNKPMYLRISDVDGRSEVCEACGHHWSSKRGGAV